MTSVIEVETAQLERKLISPLIGAELLVDLRNANDIVITQVKEAIHAHQVVFIRDQHLDEEEQLKLAQRLGNPTAMPTSVVQDEPPIATFEITAERPPRADMWHSDLTFYAAPPAYGMLNCVIAPEAGGETVFASNYEAYDALSEPLRRWCDGLKALHMPTELLDYAKGEWGPESARLIEEKYGPRIQPLVIRHPYSGRRALYMSQAYVTSIDGLHPEESQTLLCLLKAPYDNPNIQIRWRWRPGDLTIWDQRAVNHRGLSNHYPAFPHRMMKSVFISDGIPIDSLAIGS